jgi:hypothetical protein
MSISRKRLLWIAGWGFLISGYALLRTENDGLKSLAIMTLIGLGALLIFDEDLR